MKKLGKQANPKGTASCDARLLCSPEVPLAGRCSLYRSVNNVSVREHTEVRSEIIQAMLSFSRCIASTGNMQAAPVHPEPAGSYTVVAQSEA